MSPKNKGTYGKAKSTVEDTPDEFVSGIQKLTNVLRPYAVRIAAVVVVLVVVVLALTIYGWWNDKKEKEGTALFASAADVLRRQIDVDPSDDTSNATSDANKPDLPDEDKPITYTSISAMAEDTLDAVGRLEAKKSDTGAGSQGKLLEARAQLDLEKYDVAAEAFRAYESSAPNETMRTVAREGVGYALEAKALAESDATAREAGLRSAITAFQAMQPKEDGPRRGYARYHEGRLLATLGETDKAEEIFKKILDGETSAGLESAVTAHIAMLSIKKSGGGKAMPDSGDGGGTGTDDSETPAAPEASAAPETTAAP